MEVKAEGGVLVQHKRVTHCVPSNRSQGNKKHLSYPVTPMGLEIATSPVHWCVLDNWDSISLTLYQHLAQKLKQNSGMLMSPPV